MQGSILYVDQQYGFLQGSDENRYYFTDNDWRGTGVPQAGHIVDFQADGQNARDVYPRVDSPGWRAAAQAGPDNYSAAARPASPAPQSKPVYNIGLSASALILLMTLVIPYGDMSVKYRFTDTGFQGFYFIFPVALLIVSILGLPRLFPSLIWMLCVSATVMSIIDDDSLFSRVSNLREQARAASETFGSVFGTAAGDTVRGQSPAIMDHLNAGFFLHVLALLSTGVLVLFFKYEIRASRIQIQGISDLNAADLANAGRGLLEGVERLTGQQVPTKQETGGFFRSFLTFNKMIAPTIITVMYYLNLAFVVFVGIGLIFSGLFVQRYGGGMIALYGLLLLLLGPLWVRLIAEFFIVIFKIHERLTRIDEKTAG